MCLIHNISFPQDIEYYRQLIPDNLTGGLKCILDAMYDMGLTVSKDNIRYIHEIKDWWCVRDGEPFPIRYCQPLKALWRDPGVHEAWQRANEAALPEKYVLPLPLLFYASLLQSIA